VPVSTSVPPEFLTDQAYEMVPPSGSAAVAVRVTNCGAPALVGVMVAGDGLVATLTVGGWLATVKAAETVADWPPLASVENTRTVPLPVVVNTGLTDPVAVVTRLPMRTPPASRNSQV
jgi:hypothetical protein